MNKQELNAEKVWTLKLRDGVWLVLRRGICVGSLTIHASGYADWSFASGCNPSRSTLRRLLTEAKHTVEV